MAVPSQAEIRLRLTEHENDSSLKIGAISWLAEGINLEGLQYAHTWIKLWEC